MRSTISVLLLAFSGLFAASGQEYIITTIAGGGLLPTQLPALGAPIGVQGLAADSSGNIFLSNGNCVYRIDRLGMLSRIAGSTEGPGFAGDGGPATSAQLNYPGDLAVDSAGNVYVNDINNKRIRKIVPDGVITTFAGNGQVGYTGDGGPAINATLDWAQGLAVDQQGNLLIADASNNAIRKVTSDGTITTLTSVYLPKSIAVDPNGTVYVTDGLTLIREITPTGNPAIAGNDYQGFTGDGGPASKAELTQPAGLSFDDAGNLYFIDGGTRIRKISTNGIIRTIAGGAGWGYSPDGVPALDSLFAEPVDTVVDAAGNLVIAESLAGVIRIIDAAGKLQTIAGIPSGIPLGEGGPATQAQVGGVGVAADAHGNLYVAGEVVQRIAPNGIVTTIAGGGIPGSSSSAGAVGGFAFFGIMGIAADSAGNVYVSNYGTNSVVRIGTDGVVSTVAGNGMPGYYGDGGPATSAELQSPWGLAVDSTGDLYIADADNYVVRKVDRSGIIHTVAGTGLGGESPDGTPATSAQFAVIETIAVDQLGNLYLVEGGRVRLVSASTGLLSTVAGGGSDPSDNVPATTAELDDPQALVVDSSGNLYILDRQGERLRRVSASTGIISTVAGTGVAGYTGDMGLAENAEFNTPYGMAMDGHGNLYVSDSGNGVLRMLAPTGSRPVLGVNLVSPNTHERESRRRVNPMVISAAATVSNATGATKTAGTVTATATLSYGAKLTSMAGPGWSCHTNVCSRNDALNGSASYPPIAIVAEGGEETTVQIEVTGGGAYPCGSSVLVNVFNAHGRPIRR